MVGKPFSEEKYGIGLKKGDTATCEKVNAAITKMIVGRLVAEGHRRQPRPGRLQARRRQPADARRLLLTHRHEGCRPPPRAGGIRRAR